MILAPSPVPGESWGVTPLDPYRDRGGGFFCFLLLKNAPFRNFMTSPNNFVRRYVKIFWINPLQGHFLVIDHQDPSPLFNKVKRQRVSLFPPKNIVLDNRKLKSKCFSLLLESPAQSFDIRYILVGILNISILAWTEYGDKKN